MRVLSWNLQAGGGNRIPEIMRAVKAHDADAVVLGETTSSRMKAVLDGLQGVGYSGFAASHPGADRGVLIASRLPFSEGLSPREHTMPAHRWTEVWFPKQRVRLAGVYFPATRKPIAAFWPLVHDAVRARRDDAFLLVGDMNSGHSILDSEGEDFSSHRWFTAMPFHGMTDLWRHHHRDKREYTWYSNNRGRRNGFRIDHAFGSDLMRRRVRSVWYSHEDRRPGVSDHSALLVDVR